MDEKEGFFSCLKPISCVVMLISFIPAMMTAFGDTYLTFVDYVSAFGGFFVACLINEI